MVIPFTGLVLSAVVGCADFVTGYKGQNDGSTADSSDEDKSFGGADSDRCMVNKIRTDEGYRQEVEAYIAAYSGGAFTRGICSGCEMEVRKQVPRLRTNPPEKADKEVANK